MLENPFFESVLQLPLVVPKHLYNYVSWWSRVEDLVGNLNLQRRNNDEIVDQYSKFIRHRTIIKQIVNTIFQKVIKFLKILTLLKIFKMSKTPIMIRKTDSLS